LLLCGVAVSFYCHGFCKPAHIAAHCFLLLICLFYSIEKAKIKELQAHPQKTKTAAKKTGGS
jgi:hypothetical protein